MATQDQSPKDSRALKRLNMVGRRLVLGLGARVTRWMVFVVALGVLGWLLWGAVWQPLHQTVLLPGGVSGTNPEVNSELLQEITSARAERGKYTARSLFAHEPLFAPTPTPEP